MKNLIFEVDNYDDLVMIKLVKGSIMHEFKAIETMSGYKVNCQVKEENLKELCDYLARIPQRGIA